MTAGYMCPEPRTEFYRHTDAAGDATTCPGCGQAVIERDWGRRSLPVRLAEVLR